MTTEISIPDQDWLALHEPPNDLIFDDGEPLESNRHRIAMNVLIRSLLQAYTGRNDFFTGGNMFIYYSREQVKNKDYKGPDFFVVLNIDGSYPRQGWVVWDEQGRYPDVIIELASDSTAKVDLTTKKDLYERTFRTQNYFIYHPFQPDSLRGWSLGASGRYETLIPNEQGRLWCEALKFWVGTWEGIIDRESAFWLRFYDEQQTLIPLPEEAEHQRAEAERQRAEAERQKAERLAERLRQLGEDPENI